MSSEPSIWFRLGYALERAKQRPPATGKRLSGMRERERRRPERSDSPEGTDWPGADDLIASGVAALIGKALDAWPSKRRVGLVRLVRAGLAGAGAALVLDLLRPLLDGRPEVPVLDRDTVDRLLAGAGQGLLYGAVVEPRIPGPALFKGALFASAEYATDSAGGLSHLLRAHTPQGKVPALGDVLDELEPHDQAYLDHLVFGIALALLCGSSPRRNGAPVVDEDDR